MSIDKFTKAYIDCALWSSSDNHGDPMDYSFDIPDIAPETISQMESDCLRFQRENAELLSKAGADDQNGHDFWLTRNDHGAGFWDRGYGDVGDLLTKACEAFGEFSLYVGDDGRIYVS